MKPKKINYQKNSIALHKKLGGKLEITLKAKIKNKNDLSTVYSPGVAGPCLEIQKNVEKLGKHIKAYDEYYKKLGNSLSTTVNHYNTGYKELNKIDKDVTRITGESAGIDVLEIDKPQKGEE